MCTTCFFYDPITSLSENNLYQQQKGYFDFTAQYNNLKNANVGADVLRAIAHKDKRFIAISVGKSYSYPGLTTKQEALVKRYKFKVVQGTGTVKNKNAPSVQGVASAYAKKYNSILLGKING